MFGPFLGGGLAGLVSIYSGFSVDEDIKRLEAEANNNPQQMAQKQQIVEKLDSESVLLE